MEEDGQGRAGRPSARDLLRTAFVNDDDPRFPLWLPLPGLIAALAWAAYQHWTDAGAFLPTALWPGAAIFLLVSLAAWLGWQLEID